MSPLERLLALRQHAQDGQRSPHKPLLVLLALGRLRATGSSAVPWSVAEQQLADLLAEYGRVSRTSRVQSAAYPFTRLRSDGVWQLDADVPMDDVGPLRAAQPVGRLVPELEEQLADPDAPAGTARALVAAHFPESLVPDVLAAVGFDPEAVLLDVAAVRRRDPAWRAAVLQAWDLSCAFCGYDGLLGGAAVGLEAAHVRWHAMDGPDSLDNGLALCALHHKLFDRGALGIDDEHRVVVSSAFTARTDAGRSVYALRERPLTARPGTPLPRDEHVRWHAREVFKGGVLAS